jgi:hypothetical protein
MTFDVGTPRERQLVMARSCDLSWEAVGPRLEGLRALAPIPELTPPAQNDGPDGDMSPAAVGRRLEELRALDDLAQWLLACRRPPDGG